MLVKKCAYCEQKKLQQVTRRLDDVWVLECANCGLMMTEQIDDHTEDIYTAEYFEKKEGTRVGYTNYLSSPSANLVGKYALAKLTGSTGGRYLDLGSADGSLMELFTADGYTAMGIEISKDAGLIAQKKGLDVTIGKTDKFSAGHNDLDIITAFDLLEHLEDLVPTLGEITKNLKTGGYFVFSTLCVTTKSESDYWFNNSLEHYIYFNYQSLSKILKETFGEENFGIVELETNGVTEIWGFARKGTKLTSENRKIIETINSGDISASSPSEAYYLSLFYDQVSKFDKSEAIIEKNENSWTETEAKLARFYNLFYQGRFQRVLEDFSRSEMTLPLNSPTYWQAMLDVERSMNLIHKEEYAKQRNDEVQDLRKTLYEKQNELQMLHNSRVVGPAIRFRAVYRKIKAKLASHKAFAVHFAKRVVNRLRRMRYISRIQNRRQEAQKELVEKEAWNKKYPLVSVIMPYLNRASTVDETIKSLDNQTFKDFDITIIDDGSTEPESIYKLSQLKATHPRLQVLTQSHSGPAAGRNNGVSHTNSKYIMNLDSDDIIDSTFSEKAVTVLETNPNLALVTTHMEFFGTKSGTHHNSRYNPLNLIRDNMVITSALYVRPAWEAVGGYKAGIGYEDWEFWISLAEKGFWGKLIPEKLFKYRTAVSSQFTEDVKKHKDNLAGIKKLHPKYRKNVLDLMRAKDKNLVYSSDKAMLNLNKATQYLSDQSKDNVIMFMSWMTFGGAETLTYNFSKQLKNTYNITYMTGLPSDNEWEYKFREVTPNIYHLSNLFDYDDLKLEFVANYIQTRQIKAIHIIHCDFVFKMLPELKARFPELKVLVTLFNNIAGHYKEALKYEKYIDVFSTDNHVVEASYKKDLSSNTAFARIPNGVDCLDTYNPDLVDAKETAGNLNLADNNTTVFYMGRLSPEKNPDKFVKIAKTFLDKHPKNKDIKFFVVGDGPMNKEIVNLIKNSRHEDQIHYLGYKSDIPKYLKLADFLILPSSVEGFPLSVIEAMSMGVVVIASRVGEVPHILKDGKGVVADIKDLGSFIKPLEELIADKLKQNKIKAAAREEANKKYSLQALGDNYTKLFLDLKSKD